MIVIHKANPLTLPPMTPRQAAIARALVAGARAVAAATDQKKLLAALEAQDIDWALVALDWQAAGTALLSMLPKHYLAGHQEGKQDAARMLRRALRKAVGMGFDFGRPNPDSVEWAQTRSGELIREWGITSRAALRVLMQRAFEEGIPPRQLMKLIRTSGIGLTDRQAMAVLRRRAQLIKDGVASTRVEALTERYSSQLLRYRSETIARTETIAAQTAGNQAEWRSAADEGYLNPATARQVWDALGGCEEVCQPLDGEEAPIGEAFPGGFYGPPAHPNCRCTLKLRP